MNNTLRTALILAGCAFVIALVFTKLPMDTLTGQATSSTSSGQATSSKTTLGQSPHVLIGGRMVRVDIADTPAEREQGLSGRKGLAEDEGMLFIFPEDGRYGFWMKDMLFSIDILWLSSGGEIVDMMENATPDTYPESSFLPNVAARYTVELPEGFASRYNVKIGDTVGL